MTTRAFRTMGEFLGPGHPGWMPERLPHVAGPDGQRGAAGEIWVAETGKPLVFRSTTRPEE